MKYPTKKKRGKDSKCIICGKTMRVYYWKEILCNTVYNICSDWWCSEKCYKKFKKILEKQ